MKVGILSMQQITNYGSFLQAYGLKSIIEGLGHEVEFIDIVPGEQLSQYRIGRFHKFGLLWKRLFVKHPLRQLRCTLKLHKRLDKEFKPELGVGVGNNSHFDAVVIGSDEVFNIAQTTWFGFSTQLFGEGLNADKVLSYAGCFGATTLGILKELNVHNKIGGLLKHKGSYMLVYTYPGRMNKPDEVLAIKKYARSKGLRIISNANYFDWVDEVITPHPFEVLGYFRRAECIVTDTFHGAVMSLKYNKPFSVIVRGMNSNKLTYLLEQFGLKQRIVGNISKLATIMEQPVGYDSVNAIIDVEKERTIEYLKDNLQ